MRISERRGRRCVPRRTAWGGGMHDQYGTTAYRIYAYGMHGADACYDGSSGDSGGAANMWSQSITCGRRIPEKWIARASS